ncbi:lactonase family protein [Roseimaritima ulvae]|uniref:6-phosphogluconolactonase n=1 Tax=Roseimaritima ulvae TaxID=980254 RepID=A0A5B9QXM7_9BACT|nr:lactonase family protein [Roseimaritima ulvae]QEG42762.1 6-phosphogluconolactonase [Roseimaritima ulvae]
MPFPVPVLFGGLVLAGLLCGVTSAQTVDVWFGTTTPRGGLSKGIYHANFDSETGKLSKPTLAAEISSPGFLTRHPKLPILYSVGAVDGEASVVAYAIAEGDGAALEKINAQPIGDGGAAHLSTDATGSVLLTAQYGGGSTALFPLANDGHILPRQQLEKHSGGSGIVDRRQDAPHAHWTGHSPDNRFAFVPDLGMDKVVIWRLHAETSPPRIEPHGFGVCPPGSGPRHMKFHPNGKRIYVLNELSLSVTVFDYDPQAGTMEPLQTVETLSEAQKAGESFNSASEIRVHPSGRFVYTANRGHDTITVFRVDPQSDLLTLVEQEPIRGGWPRNFALDPSGRWLLAAGRDSHTVAVFAIDPEGGQLTYTRQMAMVPSPICVLFDRHK